MFPLLFCIKVNIEFVKAVQDGISVNVAPYSEDDWEILVKGKPCFFFVAPGQSVKTTNGSVQ
jgi:hypothetical protein